MSLLVRRAISTLRYLPRHQVSPFSTSNFPLLKPNKEEGIVSVSPRPRPTEIPFQSKVANSVSLFGIIQMPIHFHATPDGKHMAATLIAQNHVKSSQYLSIPVVFEGDLAHTVAFHVKQDDCVCVSGKLSYDPLPFVLCEDQGRVYVSVDELSFVEGLEMQKGNEVLNTRKKRFSNGDDVRNLWKDLLKNPLHWQDYREMKSGGLLSARYPDFKRTDGTKLWLDKVPKWVLEELDGIDQVPKRQPAKGLKVKNEDSWRCLIESPDQWCDNRSKKISIKSPDFRHKDTGEGLWLHSSPEWVLPQLPPSKHEQNVSDGYEEALEGLDVDAQVRVPKWRTQKSRKVKNEVSWKNLVESPDKWWDIRPRKIGIKSPDFRHKDTGEALWLNSSPEWVLNQLPPLKIEHNVSAGNKKASEGIDVDSQVQVPKWQSANVWKVKNEDSWNSLVESPHNWWDNRSGKINNKAHDFKHKDTGEGLWLKCCPEWLLSQLPPP